MLIGYIRERLSKESYFNFYALTASGLILADFLVIRVSKLMFLNNLVRSDTLLPLIYYSLLVKPILNLLLFVYLGDFMQNYVYKSTVLQILLQGVLINGFGNVCKLVNNQVLRCATSNGFSMSVYSGCFLALLMSMYVTKQLAKTESFLHQFKPAVDKFNAKTLRDPSILIKGFRNVDIILPVFLSVFCFTFLNQYYGRIKVFAISATATNPLLVVAPKTQLLTGEKALKEYKQSRLYWFTVLARYMSKLSSRVIVYARAVPAAVMRGDLSSYFLKLLKKQDLTEQAIGVKTTLLVSKVEPLSAIEVKKSKEFVQYLPVMKQILMGHILQICLFFLLLAASYFKKVADQIYGVAFLLPAMSTLSNAGYNATRLISLHHTFQAIDMALKKPTKDYAYTSVDYDSKQYIRIISEVLFEPVGRLLGYVAGELVIKHSLEKYYMGHPTFFVPVTPTTTTVSLLVATGWLLSNVALVIMIRRAENKKKDAYAFLN